MQKMCRAFWIVAVVVFAGFWTAPAHADRGSVIGIGGPVEGIVVVDLTALVLPPVDCKCLSVVEARLLGTNGHTILLRVGRLPWILNKFAHGWLQIRYTTDEPEVVDGVVTLVRKWNSIDVGEAQSGRDIRLTIDTTIPTVTLDYEDHNEGLVTLGPLELDMPWDGPAGLRLQARNSHDKHMRFEMELRQGSLPGWQSFISANSPFRFLFLDQDAFHAIVTGGVKPEGDLSSKGTAW